MMNAEEKSFWVIAEQLLQILLDQVREKLDIDAVKAVQHYIDHSEYEMAYEGLFTELMKLETKPLDVDFNTYTELGKSLKLDTVSIFDSMFWIKYTKYASI